MKPLFCVVLLVATGAAASVGAAEPVAPAPATTSSAFAEGWTLRSALPADVSEEDKAAAGPKGADVQRSARWSDPSPARSR